MAHQAMICGVVPEDVNLAHCAIEEVGEDASDPNTQISYGALLAHAAHLIGRLPKDSKGSCMAVLCEGAAFVVAMFSLARSGCVAVPLNPHDPPARLRVILEDADVHVALVDGEVPELREAFIELFFIRVLYPDGLDQNKFPEVVLPAAQPEDLCYLVYTSGSTGKPKGVAVEHRHLRMYCDALNTQTSLSTQDRMLVVTAVNWDPCLSDVARTLLAGATVVFVARDHLLQDLQGELIRLSISQVFATPSWWSLLEGPVDVAGLSAGEPFRPPLAELVPRVRNMYGVTEATVAQTLGPLGGSVHVGWSIDPNIVRIDVVSEGEREGEIVMTGSMVARGYWLGRAFDGTFATGDRGKFDELGALHVLGRMDHQVKVRGHRVELGEVESALRRLADVGDAVALLHGHALVACCEPKIDCPHTWCLAPASWSTGVAQLLPAPFRPAPLLRGQLPRLDNGKADRRQVADLVSQFLKSCHTSNGESLTGTERIVAQLWEDVLPVTGKVGRDDSFFALGGTSLAAVRLLRLLPAALAASGLRVDRRVAWCGLHRHPVLHAYAAFVDWAASAPDKALVDPEKLDMLHVHPLAAAAASGDQDACAELLQENSANGSWQADRPCETPLHAAARQGHATIVELLLKHRAKVTAATSSRILPIHLAAQHGHMSALQILIEADAPLDAKDWNRWSPLFFSVSSMAEPAVELLLTKNCEVTGKDRWGRTVLSLACQAGSDMLVKRLLQAKATPGARLQARQAEKWHTDWRPELHCAVLNPKCVSLLLDARANFSYDLHGRSALYHALRGGQVESARLLLEAKCSVDEDSAAVAREDMRFECLGICLRDEVEERKATRPSVLLYGIPPWQPADVKLALRACFHRARVRVASSGQGGVCLGTAVVEASVSTPTLLLRSADREAEVGVTTVSGNDLADQAFPLAPESVRRELQLSGPIPPPRSWELVSGLGALAAGSQPAAQDWTWADWAAWLPGPSSVVLMQPGMLGLQLIYEGFAYKVCCPDKEWSHSADLLCTWRPSKPADGASVVAGSAGAADTLRDTAAVLWATEWPWPEADVEIPCPDGVLLIILGPVGELGSSFARAWHAVQPWRESRSARKLWKGGAMGEQ